MIVVSSLATVIAAGAVVGGLALASATQPVRCPCRSTWTPPARADAAIGYDPDTKQVLMFGGQGDYGSLGDTWVFDGSTWRQEHTAQAPAARSDAGMVFDPGPRALVLLRLGHWEWRGLERHPALDWPLERRSTATVPYGIYDQTILQQDHMAYDAVTGKVVLVGIPWRVEYQGCVQRRRGPLTAATGSCNAQQSSCRLGNCDRQ